jgi:hypothetical protein
MATTTDEKNEYRFFDGQLGIPLSLERDLSLEREG